MSDRHPTHYQHVRSKNDVNGNPRRVWLVYANDGSFYDAIDEGYSGRPQALRELIELPSMSCTPTEYRDWLKMSRSHGRYFGQVQS